jgi:hypothetical protein
MVSFRAIDDMNVTFVLLVLSQRAPALDHKMLSNNRRKSETTATSTKRLSRSGFSHQSVLFSMKVETHFVQQSKSASYLLNVDVSALGGLHTVQVSFV